MKNRVKVLHVASFTGNIGDEANHRGFRLLLESKINKRIEWEEVEIRNFYKKWGLNKFDSNFAKKANKYDLLVIGGGNFLEMKWDYSKTGTTIDMGIDILNKIKIPILFNALGLDDNKGTNEDNIKKLHDFLLEVGKKDNIYFTLRNDGSYKVFKKYFNNIKMKNFKVIPDWGFYVNPKKYKHIEIDKKKINIGINLAGDMKEIRYGKNYKYYMSEFAKLFTDILEKNEEVNLVFLPHMYLDLQPIIDVMGYIDDYLIRKRITVAPLLSGNITDGTYIFNLYSQLDIILGMRFHSNVCAIGQNIPNIGIITYPKHGELFDEIGLKDRSIEIKDKEFFYKINDKLNIDLKNIKSIRDRYKKINLELLEKTNIFLEDFITMLEN